MKSCQAPGAGLFSSRMPAYLGGIFPSGHKAQRAYSLVHAFGGLWRRKQWVIPLEPLFETKRLEYRQVILPQGTQFTH